MFIRPPLYAYYYSKLHIAYVVNKIRYHFAGKAIIYGLRCRVTNMYYIGSTFDPRERIRAHLITGHSSNLALQDAISIHGIDKFNMYIFEVVTFPKGATYHERLKHLHRVEQSYLDMFPKAQLYNSSRASADS